MLKLENGLDGVYDLNNVQDCRKVIQVLLRDVAKSNARATDSLVKLKGLALKVMSGSSDVKDAARAALTDGASGGVDVLGYMMRMVQEMSNVRAMHDDVLVSEVIDKVWANYDMSGNESALVAELIERFNARAAVASA